METQTIPTTQELYDSLPERAERIPGEERYILARGLENTDENRKDLGLLYGVYGHYIRRFQLKSKGIRGRNNKLESRVYLELQKIGEAKVGMICKNLNIPNSHIYTTLNSLIEKGLVSFKYANKVRVFGATSPETLKLLFDKKQEELKDQEKSLGNLIESLKKLPKNKETESDYQYFEGENALKNAIFEVYSTSDENSEMLLFSSQAEAWERLNAFLMEMHKIRVKRKISLKMILQNSSENLQKIISERKKLGYVEIRSSNFNNKAEFLCTKDSVFILDLSKKNNKPCGFLIKNVVFVSLFEEIFDFIWDKSE